MRVHPIVVATWAVFAGCRGGDPAKAPPAPAAPAPKPAPKLDGIWEAKRHFGPEVRGPLELARAGATWQARIAGYEQAVTVDRDHLTFALPGARGSFVGRLGKDDVIRGHWVQPPDVNSGSKYASPVVLRAHGKDSWRGDVVPLDDDFTLDLVMSHAADGSLQMWIRNPDRNAGLRWAIDRVAQDGDHIQLLGKPPARGAAPVIGEGTYHADDPRLSIYFPQRGGSYDFSPIGDDPTPGFYARGKHPPPYVYQPPPADDDGWKVGTLDEVGMVPGPIAELVAAIEVPPATLHDPDIHGFLIARHGTLVAEEYFHGFHRDRPHDTRSAAKSVTATLVGAAIQHGAPLDPSTRVYDLFYKGAPPAGTDPRKLAMTVEHLLTMSSGYDCDDWAGSRPGSEDTILDDQPDPDYYRYILQLPMQLAPGTQAVYCSINPDLLGDVVATATGRPVLELFQELIAEPLQIRRYYLDLQPTGEPYLGGGQKYLPRDFMKFGQLMLDGGVWNGTRIVSKAYAERASSPLVTLRGNKYAMKYGYLWWTVDYTYKGRTVAAYFASGNGGQEVVVIPALDLVIAAYGGSYADAGGWIMVRTYIEKYILPALVDETR